MLLQQLALIPSQPDHRRPRLLNLFLENNLAIPKLTRNECFAAAGDENAEDYWGYYLSEPQPITDFVTALSLNSADTMEHHIQGRQALMYALRDAVDAGQEWIRGPTEILETWTQDEWWQLFLPRELYADGPKVNRIKVRTREAVEWMMRMPKRRHLVPEDLRRILIKTVSEDLEELSEAPDEEIRDEIRTVYANFPAKEKPNVKITYEMVRNNLLMRSLSATKNEIQRIAEEIEFRGQRLASGKHRKQRPKLI